MVTYKEFQHEVLELIELFESAKHVISRKHANSSKGLNFAGVALLTLDEPDPYENSFIGKRTVRSEMPNVYTWLFRKFVPVLSKLPNYGALKEEIFGRLGNTIQMAEASIPPLTPDEKVAAVFSDFYEIGQDMLDGKVLYSAVAFGGSVADDWVTRNIKSDYVNLTTFERELFGTEN